MGLLVAQAAGTTLSVYGVLSGLTPSSRVTCVVAETSCLELLQVAGQGVSAVAEFDGAVIIEGVQPIDAAASSAEVARSGFAGVYDSDGKLLMCTQLQVVANTQVVLVGRMPAQFNQRTAQGLVIFQREAVMGSSKIQMTGILFGLESEFHGMWHLNRGFNCLGATEDAAFYQGVYDGCEHSPRLSLAQLDRYKTNLNPKRIPNSISKPDRTGRTSMRGGDPWNYGNYRSDPRGVALISKTMTLDSPDLMNTMSREMAEFKGECGGAMPPTFVGRQLTVHGRDGSYIGCGTVAGYMPGVTDAIAVLSKHYHNSGNPPKTLIHINEKDQLVQITAVISGLAVRQSVEIHIHAGFECPGPDEVLSMLYSPSHQQPNPTMIQTGNSLFVLTTETADSYGNIFFQSNINSTSLSFLAGCVITIQQNYGSAFVCGTIEPTALLVAPLVPSVTAAPSVDVSVVRGGLIMAAQAGTGVALRGTVLMSAALGIESPCFVSFKAKCSDTANLIPQIPLERRNGVCQLTKHVLQISIDPFAGGGASLRGAFVTVSSRAGEPSCGSLIGPLSEVPTPDPNLCYNDSDDLRGASIGFIVLSTIVLVLLTAMYMLLRADAAEKTVIHVSTAVAKKMDAARKVSSEKVAKAKHSIHSVRRRPAAASGPKDGVHVHLLGEEAASIDMEPSAPRIRNDSVKFQLKSDPFAAGAKPRLLALHGMGSNKEVTKRQLRNLGITEELFTLVFLNGSVKAAQEGPGLEGLFEGPFYSWFDKNAMDKETLLEMLGSVVMFIKKNNIDGLFGFSQGGVVASAIMQPEIRELICSYLGVRLRRDGDRYNANFKYQILHPCALGVLGAGPRDAGP